jgi:hypothetical protein
VSLDQDHPRSKKGWSLETWSARRGNVAALHFIRALPVLIESFRFDQNGKKGSNTYNVERFLIAKVEQLWREALQPLSYFDRLPNSTDSLTIFLTSAIHGFLGICLHFSA